MPPIALVLFGGSLSASQKLSSSRPGEALLSVDGWITVAVSARVQKLLVLVRQHLDSLLQVSSYPTLPYSSYPTLPAGKQSRSSCAAAVDL